MKELLTALANFSPAQLLTSLAILTPFVAAIWAAMKWAYDTRLKNLETALADFRSDFERKLARETAKLTDAQEVELDTARIGTAEATEHALTAERALDAFKRNEETRNVEASRRQDQLADAERRFVSLLEDLGGGAPLTTKYVEYLSENPSLLTKLTFSQAQIDDLEGRAGRTETNAMYVLGRMLTTGRLLSDGLLAPNRERGVAMIDAAADCGHSQSKDEWHLLWPFKGGNARKWLKAKGGG